MLELKLKTHIDKIQMADRLRNRLKLAGCKTFADAMEADYEHWENVSPKVLNAMKRFREENADVYAVLLRQSEEKVTDKAARCYADTIANETAINDERRFFIANNLLNAYASSGLLLADETTLHGIMNNIMYTADLFLAAYNSESPSSYCDLTDLAIGMDPEDLTDDLDMDEDDMEVMDISELILDRMLAGDNAPEPSLRKRGRKKGVHGEDAGSDDGESTNKKPAKSRRRTKEEMAAMIPQSDEKHPWGKKGDTVIPMNYHGKRASKAQNFRPGDALEVVRFSTLPNGNISVTALTGDGKSVTFASNNYDWELRPAATSGSPAAEDQGNGGGAAPADNEGQQ